MSQLGLLSIVFVLTGLTSTAFAHSFFPFITRLNSIKKSWSFTDTKGVSITALRPLTRVVVLNEFDPIHPGKVFVVTAEGSDLKFGYLSTKAIAKSRLTPAYQDQFEVFLQDANTHLALAQARSPMQKYTPHFKRLVDRMQKEVQCLTRHRDQITEPQWRQFRFQIQKRWQVNLKDKPETLQRYRELIFGALNPTGAKGLLSLSTVIVPISAEWFQSDKMLARYFDQKWINGHFDIRLFGNSGEGLSRSEARHDFEDMAARFIELESWIKFNDPNRTSDPEYRWLQEFSKMDLTRIVRLIFIHDRTWVAEKNKEKWQDFIPVDQSFGSVVNPNLLSVLIHEINVNSVDPYFLPGDTHSPNEESQQWWAKLKKEKKWLPLSDQNADAEAESKILGISPKLGAIVLAVLMNELNSISSFNQMCLED